MRGFGTGLIATLAGVLFSGLGAGVGTAQTATTPIALEHVNVTNVDTSVSPCENFFRYACGKVNAANPIPPDQSAWGSLNRLSLWNQGKLRAILEANAPSKPGRTANQQKIGDFYASCVEQADAGRNDDAVLTPLRARIEGMKTKRDLAVTLEAVQVAFSHMWEGGDNQSDTALFGFGPTPDYNDTNRVVTGVDQGGLGLMSRESYLGTDAKTQEVRAAYRKLVEAELAMDGMSADAAKAGAATVMRIETALAQAQMDNITRRDPNKMNNRYTLAQLKALMPEFDFDSYIAALGAPAVPVYEVSSPEFFRAVNKMLTTEEMATWKVYLRWQLVHSASGSLGNTWRDQNFQLTKVLYGSKEQAPTWRRCSARTDAVLGQALGQVYVQQVFSAESKTRVLKMVKDIEAAMGRDIDNAAWMQPETRKQAHLKLAAIVEKIGYPDQWINYDALTITPQNFAENMMRANAFELHRQLGFIGKPLDRTQWLMTPSTVDAYEDPQGNTINFPAGILQPPFFDPAADDVINYGSEGAVLGHELTHDFDDQGRKFDQKGNLRDWWTPEDAKNYEERGACIAKEYTGPVPNLEGVTQNGKLTQGEDTADNGGVYLALSALTQDLMQQGKSLEDKDANGLTNQQRFFLAFATDWCGQTRPEMGRQLLAIDPHSQPELRVNNTVGNMPEFAKAFSCKAGQPMVHVPACRVW